MTADNVREALACAGGVVVRRCSQWAGPRDRPSLVELVAEDARLGYDLAGRDTPWAAPQAIKLAIAGCHRNSLSARSPFHSAAKVLIAAMTVSTACPSHGLKRSRVAT